MPIIDLQIQMKIKNEKNILKNIIAQQYLDQTYSSWVQIFTDGSKDPVSGRTAAAVYIPKFQISIKKRITDHISIFAAELVAMMVALQWVEDVKPRLVAICSDSFAAITSLVSGNKVSRQDIIYEILASLLRISSVSLIVFVWVPAHVGLEANEVVDRLAKQAVKHNEINVQVMLSKNEVKSKIKEFINNKWQELWNNEVKGRQLYSIQKQVGNGRSVFRDRKEDTIVSRIRIGGTHD